MASRTTEMKEMTWDCGDVFKMDSLYSPQTFDVAIDKGTLDAFLTVKHDPWNPSKELLDRISLYISQVSNTLKQNGLFLHVTFSQPRFRKQFLELGQDWQVEVYNLSGEKDAFEYYIYACYKT